MNEEFLIYVWRYKLIKIKSKTADGTPLEIISVGERNTDSGPDFINAKIKIGNTVWAGNVEVHVNSSDWFKHKHQSDKAYSNIILHVVYNNDADIYRNSYEANLTFPKFQTLEKFGEKIQVYELKNKFNEQLYRNYKNFIENKSWIPCQNLIVNTDKLVLNSWLETLLVERIERKIREIDKTLSSTKNDWEQTFYLYLAKNFGFKTNALPFEMLAKATPLAYLSKHRDNLFQIEAILFGQAGLLAQDFNDGYIQRLQAEYKYLKHKFSLTPIDGKLWKFMRLRPANFPTIRIAQFAYLLHKTPALFSEILGVKDINKLYSVFNIKTSEYWEYHFMPDKECKKGIRRLGKSSVRNLILNTIVQFVFLYGLKKDNFAYKEKALKYLESIEAESNKIIKSFNEIGIKAENAFDSQALIELKNEYCTKKRCLDCRIGHNLLQLTIGN